MKKIPKWSLVVGLLLLAVALMAAGTVVALHRGDDTPIPMPNGNIVSGHKDSGSISDSDCRSCHGPKENETSLDPLNIAAHKRHLKSVYLAKPCGSCHASTDVSLGSVTTNETGDVIYDIRLQSYEGDSSATARKQVNSAVCVSCHGKFTEDITIGPVYPHRDDGTAGGTPWPSADPQGCLKGGCHDSGPLDPTATHTAAGTIDVNFSSTAYSCLKCHGGYNWFEVVETN